MEENNTKSETYWMLQPMVIALVLAGGFLLGWYFQGDGKPNVITGPHGTEISSYNKLSEILNFIQTKYVDSVDIDHLADVAAGAMLKELDPHSYYIPKQDAEAINNRMQGNIDGIGVEFFLFRDTVYIIDIISNSPAADSELSRGDAILSINDSLVSGYQREVNEILELFRGSADSEVKLIVFRAQKGEKLEIKLSRSKVPVNSIGSSYMIEEDLLYIKLNSFNSRSYSEFMQVIEDAVKNRNEISIILDLRHNPGGYLQEAIKILSQLFPRAGTTLVRTKGLYSIEKTYRSSGRNFFSIDRVAVLIDGASASASEIIAGVVQDLDRGIVVGTESYGKGSVQEHYTLRDESALRLTVSKYFIPSGRSILKNENVFSPENLRDSNQLYYTSNGREVWQGSAITPDITVPTDSIFVHSDFNQIMQLVNKFAFSYFIEQPDKGKSLTTEDIKHYIPEQWKDELLEFAVEENSQSQVNYLIESDVEKVYSFLEARLARFFLGENAYYEILNQTDPVVNSALHALDNEYQAMLSNDR